MSLSTVAVFVAIDFQDVCEYCHGPVTATVSQTDDLRIGLSARASCNQKDRNISVWRARRLANCEMEQAEPNTAALIREQRRKDKLRNKFESLLWAIGAWLVVSYSQFILHLFSHPDRNLYFLYVGFASLATVVALFLYLSFYVGTYRGIRESEWQNHSPLALYAMIVAGFGVFIGFLVGLWGVWGVLTPVILFVLFMGFLMPCAHLVPKF